MEDFENSQSQASPNRQGMVRRVLGLLNENFLDSVTVGTYNIYTYVSLLLNSSYAYI